GRRDRRPHPDIAAGQGRAAPPLVDVPGTPLGAGSLRGPDHARLVVGCEERIGFRPWLRDRRRRAAAR
ncbi:hypothetical protein ACWEP2_43205, partial [Streptomyces sp. NPDC004279]